MTTRSSRAPRVSRWSGELLKAFVAVASIAATTWVAVTVFGLNDLANDTILFVFVIAAISVRLGYRASILAAIVGALLFDYYFLAPYYSLAIANGRQLVTFGALFVVAIFTSTMNERLRKEARSARVNERRTEQLYSLARDLAGASGLTDICTEGLRQIETAANVSAVVLIGNGAPSFERALGPAGVVPVDKEDGAMASWVARHLQPGGHGSRAFPDASSCLLPLVAGRGCVGVLVLRPRGDTGGPPVRISSLLLSMAQQLAMAIERALLADEKRAAELETETERIRNAVLSSVSHDLRTPLATIASASSTLVEHGDRLNGPSRAEMSRIIHDEARRLNELLKSLLDVTRLQSGGLSVRREWESVEEVVGAALHRLEDRLGPRRIFTSIPGNMPLLQIDATLIEQVLVNLIDNAIKYASIDQPIEINVSNPTEEQIVLSVIDHGKGIKGGEFDRIFQKFYRSATSAGAGLGLGLTIARGIIEAHGGKIWATETPGGGLTVQFSLPSSGVAPRPTEADVMENVA